MPTKKATPAKATEKKTTGKKAGTKNGPGPADQPGSGEKNVPSKKDAFDGIPKELLADGRQAWLIGTGIPYEPED